MCRSRFVNGIKKEGLCLIRGFGENGCVFYVYGGGGRGKGGGGKRKDGKIDMKNVEVSGMEKMEMKDIEGRGYSLIGYWKGVKCKVRVVMWEMGNGKKKVLLCRER